MSLLNHMIYFKWRYYNEKLKKQVVLKIPTGFAPMIFQDIYERLVERYVIQLDWCVYSKSWQSFAAFDNIIIIHTYRWTCNRSTIGILKNIVVWTSTTRRVFHASMVVPFEEGLNLKLLYAIEIKLWVWPLTLFTK